MSFARVDTAIHRTNNKYINCVMILERQKVRGRIWVFEITDTQTSYTTNHVGFEILGLYSVHCKDVSSPFPPPAVRRPRPFLLKSWGVRAQLSPCTVLRISSKSTTLDNLTLEQLLLATCYSSSSYDFRQTFPLQKWDSLVSLTRTILRNTLPVRENNLKYKYKNQYAEASRHNCPFFVPFQLGRFNSSRINIHAEFSAVFAACSAALV